MTKKAIQDMDERELIYTLLADKVGSVDPKDVIYVNKIDSGKHAGTYSIMIGGKKVTQSQLSNLQAEAATFQSMELFKIITNTLPHEAELRMFKLAKNERDMDWGKAILHAVGVIETIVRAVQNPLVDEKV